MRAGLVTARAKNPTLSLLLWDVALPLAAYYGLRLAGQSEQVALLAGAGVAAARIAWVAVRDRSFDGFAALLAGVLGVGLVLSLVTGDAKFLLLKESFATATAAIVLLLSCFSRTPMVLVAVRAGSSAAKRAEIDRLAEEVPGFRRAFTRMSAVWGVALLLEAAIRVPLVYTLSADVMNALSVVLLLAVIGGLSLWSVRYAEKVQKKHTVAT
ncbi:VC0807 family protein [Amycolatopsis sp. WAC 04182]|uniref:VC0807 family protein n=1 Tax=Amycolatopsis sp. WAC 04182 TaxID=2203198 RepID=UPI001F1B3074|nr:VC0807 family protein [Amycolatopsis sp. WAC 04182]